MSNHLYRQKPARTQKEKAFDRQAEKEMRKQAARTVEQHKGDLSIFTDFKNA